MKLSAEERVDRSFWLIDGDGERHFPIRVARKDDPSAAFFRVAEKGNKTTDAIEVDSIEEVRDFVVNRGFSVAAVPESNINQSRSLLKLHARKILSWGSSSGDGQSLASYWRALATTAGDPDAGWADSLNGWVRLKQRNGVYVVIALNGREGWVRIGLGVSGDEAGEKYEALLAKRAVVERAAGEPLTWDAKEGREKRQLFVKLMCDPNDRADWERQHSWLVTRLPIFERLLELV